MKYYKFTAKGLLALIKCVFKISTFDPEIIYADSFLEGNKKEDDIIMLTLFKSAIENGKYFKEIKNNDSLANTEKP